MTTNDKKFPNFIGDLKSSNIASNLSSLNFCSDQILLLLDQINLHQNNSFVENNLKNSKNTITKTKNTSTSELIENFFIFGEFLKTIIDDLKKNEDNIKFLKKIAIHYIDVAKLTKDERIKNLAFIITDEISL